MKTAFKRTLLSTLVVPFALGATSASAAMITEWGYVVNSSFSNATETEGEIPTLEQPDARTLTWGQSANKSSISITDVDFENGGVAEDERLFTNGDSVNGGVFTHTNNRQPPPGAALESFDLTSDLTLYQVAPDGDAERSTSRTIESFFSETLDGGSCFAASSGSGCDDIFTIGNIDDLNVDVVGDVYKFVSSEFTIDDYNYTVFLELDGLGELGDDACALAGAPNGCVGLLTEEGLVNNFQTRFSISASEVPEPGTLALLGLGLTGLGLARRKKAANA